MKSGDNDKKQVTDALKQMPPIKSGRHKEELYKQITSSLKEQNKKPSSPKIRFMPVFSIVMVLAILLFSVPLLMNERNISTNSSQDEAKLENASRSNFNDKSGDHGPVQFNKKNILKSDNGLQSYVVGPEKNTESIVHGAVANKQAQFIVPLTFIVPETEGINKQYNNMGDYLNNENWLASEYMLSDAAFEINRSSGIVTVDLPKAFSINTGAEANLFNKTLQSMFSPLQIRKVVFTSKVNLGPIGNVNEVKINELHHSAYKVFNSAQSDHRFLIPVNTGDQTEITAAFDEMKQTEQELQLQPTIPENIQFSIRQKGDLLQLTFTDNIPENQESMTMIEAILMTAKSFGYKQVEFKNTGIRDIGFYHLMDPIRVPAGANPIYTESK
ncbi:hypothetical protein GCM10009001_14970 [Virgibacillus siamensis]|uniref:GerMN domain-containing protein n=1 Tax=Virgibacillus siamensis TaxID=480071 RepID=A0ABN1FX45_9BACI